MGTPMTTRKKRLQVTIEPELEPILERLSKFMGKPQSTIITELLMESYPILEQTAIALELASQKRLDLSGLNEAVNKGIEKARKAESELLEILKADKDKTP